MPRVGAYLRELRERQGVSVDELSRATRVLSHYLEALETDDLASLPAPVFTKGFIRAYCQALSVPPDEALALYDQRAGHPARQLRAPRGPWRGSLRRHPRAPVWRRRGRQATRPGRDTPAAGTASTTGADSASGAATPGTGPGGQPSGAPARGHPAPEATAPERPAAGRPSAERAPGAERGHAQRPGARPCCARSDLRLNRFAVSPRRADDGDDLDARSHRGRANQRGDDPGQRDQGVDLQRPLRPHHRQRWRGEPRAQRPTDPSARRQRRGHHAVGAALGPAVKFLSGLGERLREGLRRSQEYLAGGLGAVLDTDRPIDETLLEELEELLIAE